MRAGLASSSWSITRGDSGGTLCRTELVAWTHERRTRHSGTGPARSHPRRSRGVPPRPRRHRPRRQGAAHGDHDLDAVVGRHEFFGEMLAWHAHGEDIGIFPALAPAAPNIVA